METIKAVDTCGECGAPVDEFGSSVAKWRPIATAPKDGTRILLLGERQHEDEYYGPDRDHMVASVGSWRTYWTDGFIPVEGDPERYKKGRVYNAYWDVDSHELNKDEITDWMPLPDPPEVTR